MTPLLIEVSRRGSAVLLSLAGELDSANVADTSDRLSFDIPPDALIVALDLTGLRYVDSAGIHLLFELAERLRVGRQRLTLAVPEDSPLTRMLKVTHVRDVVAVYDNADAAVEAAGNSP